MVFRFAPSRGVHDANPEEAAHLTVNRNFHLLLLLFSNDTSCKQFWEVVLPAAASRTRYFVTAVPRRVTRPSSRHDGVEPVGVVLPRTVTRAEVNGGAREDKSGPLE